MSLSVCRLSRRSVGKGLRLRIPCTDVRIRHLRPANQMVLTDCSRTCQAYSNGICNLLAGSQLETRNDSNRPKVAHQHAGLKKTPRYAGFVECAAGGKSTRHAFFNELFSRGNRDVGAFRLFGTFGSHLLGSQHRFRSLR